MFDFDVVDALLPAKQKLTRKERAYWAAEVDGPLTAREVAQLVREDRARKPRDWVPKKPNDGSDGEPMLSGFSYIGKPMELWVKALSLVRFHDAGRRDDVKDFRVRFVPEFPLAPEEIPTWIREHKPEKAAVYVTYEAPPGWDPSQATLPILTRPVRVSADTVDFPEGEWVGREYVDSGGVLAQLRHLSLSLSKDFGWQPAQAVGFVLSGSWPIVQPINVTFGTEFGPRRIALDVDPDVSSDELVQVFNSARATLAGVPAKNYRSKRPSEKALRLVCAWGDDAMAPAITNNQMRSWNKNEISRFTSRPAFRQALNGALKQLRRG